MNDTNELWMRSAEVLRDQVTDATWRTWLAGLSPRSFDGSLLVLDAPSTLVRDRVETRFLSLLTAGASVASGHVVLIRFVVTPFVGHEVE